MRAIPGQKKVTAVWLDSEIQGQEDKTKMFFCYNCRVPLLQYTGSVMQIIPGNHPYSPSTIVKCKGNVRLEDGTWEECGVFYAFISAVYTQNHQYA